MKTLLLAFLLLGPQEQQQEELRLAFLALQVNQVAIGDIGVYLGGNEIWIAVEDLEAANVSGFAGQRRDFAAREFVELASLGPDIRAQIDMALVALLVDADPRFFPQTDVEMVNPRPADIRYARNTSALLNYSVRYDTRSGTSFFGEANVSFAGNSALASFSIDEEGKFKRSLVSVTFDQPEARRRWVTGDVQGRGLLLGSAAFVGGARVGRDYSLDPYYFSYATPTFTGAVTTPSTVEVVVNGQPTQRFDIPPGNFQLSRLPVHSGLGNVNVIVRDAFGREQLLDARYYLSTRVLKRGERDYEYVAGYERQDTGTGIEYDDPIATARDRVGITDSVTLGYRLEGGERIVNGGPTVNLKIFKFGELELLAAGSSDGEQGGYAAAGTYVFTSRLFSFNSFFRWQGTGYGDLFLAPDAPREDLFFDAVGTVPILSRGSVSMGYSRNLTTKVINSDGSFSYVPVGPTTPDGAERFVLRQVTGRLTMRVARRVQLNATATWNVTTEDDFWDAFGGLTFVLGGRTSASASWERREGKERVRADINRSLSLGPGIGYRIEANDDQDGSGHASVQAQSRFARVDARYDIQRDKRGEGSVTLAGAIVGMGGRVSFSRPVSGASFALVRLPEAPGVQVFSNQQPMGRTGGAGALFVPDLLAYHGNRISFDDKQVPLDVIIGETSRVIAPPFRGGAVVEFPLRRLRAIRGTVVADVEGEPVVPEYGDLIVDTPQGEKRSPLTKIGRFYFEDIEAGIYAARLLYGGRVCSFDISIPPLLQPVTDLGELRCLQR